MIYMYIKLFLALIVVSITVIFGEEIIPQSHHGIRGAIYAFGVGSMVSISLIPHVSGQTQTEQQRSSGRVTDGGMIFVIATLTWLSATHWMIEAGGVEPVYGIVSMVFLVISYISVYLLVLRGGVLGIPNHPCRSNEQD